jgi:endonuclease-3
LNWIGCPHDDLAPDWARADGHLWLLDFGKETCRSRVPRCPTCMLNDLCLYYHRTKA